MSTEQNLLHSKQSRRRWLRATSGAAVLLPVVHLTGCGSESEPATTASKAAADAADSVKSGAAEAANTAKEAVTEAADSAQAAAEEAATEVSEAVSTAANEAAPGLVKIEESDPVAKALSYVHDASSVDKAKQPRFAAGQNCGNCAQFKEEGGEAGWGGCAIFPGKLVATNGWCAGYVAAS